jgi:hypothetical protein
VVQCPSAPCYSGVAPCCMQFHRTSAPHRATTSTFRTCHAGCGRPSVASSPPRNTPTRVSNDEPDTQPLYLSIPLACDWNITETRPTDAALNTELIANSSPVRRQLLGAMGDLTPPSSSLYWFPQSDEQLPLKAWAEQHSSGSGTDISRFSLACVFHSFLERFFADVARRRSSFLTDRWHCWSRPRVLSCPCRAAVAPSGGADRGGETLLGRELSAAEAHERGPRCGFADVAKLIFPSY